MILPFVKKWIKTKVVLRNKSRANHGIILVFSRATTNDYGHNHNVPNSFSNNHLIIWWQSKAQRYSIHYHTKQGKAHFYIWEAETIKCLKTV